MIFIGFFLFIALVAISLNMYDASNINKMEEYLKKENCSNLIYSKGLYKAICPNSIKTVENSFSLDLKKNTKEYFFKEIKNIEKEKLNLVINNANEISFKNEENLDKFYLIIEEKINNRNIN